MSADQSTEHWLPVVEFPEHYEVSDLGRVRSLPRLGKGNSRWYGGKILAPCGVGQGAKEDRYPAVSLSVGRVLNRRKVHSLVLLAFAGKPPEGHECNHKDGDKWNNRLENLEWVTRLRNIRHSIEILGNTNLKLTDADVEDILALRRSGVHPNIIAEQYQVSLDCLYERTGGRGIRFPSKITPAQIVELKTLRITGWKHAALASRFGISQSLVSTILSGKRRKSAELQDPNIVDL